MRTHTGEKPLLLLSLTLSLGVMKSLSSHLHFAESPQDDPVSPRITIIITNQSHITYVSLISLRT